MTTHPQIQSKIDNAKKHYFSELENFEGRFADLAIAQFSLWGWSMAEGMALDADDHNKFEHVLSRLSKEVVDISGLSWKRGEKELVTYATSNAYKEVILGLFDIYREVNKEHHPWYKIYDKAGLTR